MTPKGNTENRLDHFSEQAVTVNDLGTGAIINKLAKEGIQIPIKHSA